MQSPTGADAPIRGGHRDLLAQEWWPSTDRGGDANQNLLPASFSLSRVARVASRRGRRGEREKTEQKKPGNTKMFPGYVMRHVKEVRAALADPDVLGTLPLGAVAFVVLHGLAFVEAVEASPFDRGRMEENISLVSLDEAKTFVSQLLNSTLRHVTISPARSSRRTRSPRTVQLRSGNA